MRQMQIFAAEESDAAAIPALYKANLGFVKVGECELFDKQFVCLEKEL